MIEENNNDYDLPEVLVFTSGSFSVGDTLPGRGDFRDWLVHYRDATTLLIAPIDRPDKWVPAHIYGSGGIQGA